MDYEYGIKCNGKVIVKCLTSSDRDTCINALREMHPDCTFVEVQLEDEGE